MYSRLGSGFLLAPGPLNGKNCNLALSGTACKVLYLLFFYYYYFTVGEGTIKRKQILKTVPEGDAKVLLC